MHELVRDGRSMRIFVVGILLLGLTGCAASNNLERQRELAAAEVEYDAGIAACLERFPKGKKPIVPAAICHNEVDEAYGRRVARADPRYSLDLALVRNSQLLLAAEKFDAGKISKSEYKHLHNVAQAEMNTAVQQRINSANIANAAQTQATAAVRQAKAVEDANKAQKTETTCGRDALTGQVKCKTKPSLF